MSWRWLAATLCVLLGGYLVIRMTSYDLAVALVAAAALLALGRGSGLSWAELGLTAKSAPRGLAWALGSLLVVVAVYLVLVLTPLNVVLEDSRFDDGWTHALLQAFVIVPLGTVLWEEIGFRGVLWAQIRRKASPGRATAASSLLFGLWHAAPALRFAETNQAAAEAVDGNWLVIGTVAATIAVTTVAGILLCEVRRRSDSLLAPIGLHWAVNGVGVLAVAASSM